ncbi:MAG: Gfo/Idh/MocA family oxidoreductase [Spirochaetes bacterium]|nr:Gfo/Idh/MocA family oxidoreductase [Spirochaetota bacterium]
MKKINIGFIGIGNKGRGSFKVINYLNEYYNVICICDKEDASLKQFKKTFPDINNITYYSDYKKMIKNEELDAVIISTPNYTHYEIAEYAIENNKNVFLEKPMTISIEHAKKLIKLNKKKKVVFQIGMELHYHKLIRKMYEDAAGEKQIGRIIMAVFEEYRGPFLKKIDDWIIQQRYSGGTLVEKTCHHFDLFNWFINSIPVTVYASGSHDVVHKSKIKAWNKLKSRNTRQDVIDNAFVTINYKNGARANLVLSMFSPDKNHKLTLIGDNGWMCGNINNFSYDKYILQEAVKKTINLQKGEIEMNFGHGGAEYGQWGSFYNSIVNNGDIEVNAKAGLYSIAIGIAAEKSLRENKVITISEILKKQ